MGRYSGILLCSDLDGTLLNSGGQVSKENAQAVRRFRAEGGVFCLATGRLPRYLLQYGDKLDFDGPMICSNGSCIYDFATDKLLYARPISGDLVPLIQYILEHGAPHIERLVIFAGLESVAFENLPMQRERILAQAKHPVHKIVMRMDREDNTLALKAALMERFGESFNFSRSWDTGLEILDPLATKGHTVRHLRGMLGGISKVVCVGDYENDITMLKMADIGCAVANAVESVKAVADRVICSNDEHAIRYLVDRLPAL